MIALKDARKSFVCYLILLCLGIAPYAFGQTPILGEAKERQPSYGEMENFTILSYSDLNGWDQAAEFRVSRDGRHAYISNYQGFSIVDVSNPERPRVVSQVKNDPSVQSQYIDVLGNVLVVNQEGVRDEKIKTWQSGIRLFDISDHAKPREVGFFKTDQAPNRGVHGFWLHEDPKQGKFAFIATTMQGYFGAILLIVDINDPAKPKEVSRWWFPGQHTAGGEKTDENWIDDGGLRDGLPKIWVSLHDLTTYKHRAYLAYRDQGVIILDISDLKKPTQISQIKWSPPEEGNTHSIGIDRGREELSLSPPSEPCVRFSRTRLSSRWFPHRDWLASSRAATMVNSPCAAKKAFGHLI